MKELTKEGQLKVGGKIKIVGKNKNRDSYESVIIKDIVDNGFGEEVIINKRKNFYFMTLSYLDGSSWCEKVFELNK